jgi:beta-lactamase regulating signal transducer with metallopeptidase domain/HEAT repeat protein
MDFLDLTLPLASRVPSAAVLFVVRATAILLAALGMTLVMRRSSAGARHLVWLGSLAGLLLLPALSASLPATFRILPASLAPETGPASAPAAIPLPLAPAPAAQLTSGVDHVDVAADFPASQGTSRASLPAMTPLGLSLLVWGLVAVALLLRMILGALAVRRIVRRARPLSDGSWLTPLVEIADRLDLPEAPRLVMSEQVHIPFACNARHPTIVLPAEAAAWSADRRHAVLLHELAHVRRRDLLGHAVGRFACALYWFHPLVWTAAKKLRAESERACDDQALSCGTRASDYAEHLLDIVSGVRHHGVPGTALAMAQRREFEGRMLAILDPALRRSAPSRRETAMLVTALGILSLGVAAMAPAPRPARAVAHATAAPVVSPPAATPAGDAPTSVRVEHPEPAASGRLTSDRPPRPMTIPLAADTSEGARLLPQGAAKDRVTILAGVLRSDTSADLRRVAAWGLAQFGDSRVAIEALAAAVRHDASDAVREMSAWALGEASSRDAVAPLTDALRGDANPRVREMAAWGLGESGEEEAQAGLVAGLRDRDAQVRHTAVWALGEIGLKHAPTELVAMLADTSASVRGITAWALHQIGDASAAPALTAALRTEREPEVKQALLRSVASMGDEAADVIADLVNSSDRATRNAAIRALAGAGSSPWPMPRPRPRPSP